MMYKKLSVLLFILLPLVSWSQKVSFDPVDWKVNEPVKIKVDVSGTPLHGFIGNLYLWGWTFNGANEAINATSNGSWSASAATSILTHEGDNIFSITLTPTTHWGVAKELLEISGLNFLVKKANGNDNTGGFPGKSDDLTDFKPFYDNGISPNTTWAANKSIRLLIDVSGTDLAGTSDPLYLWAWYNTGAGDINSPNNGSWTSSAPQSSLTRIGSTNIYYKDFTPSEYFNTSVPLFNTNIFGLVKKLNGDAPANQPLNKTPNFGVNQPHKLFNSYQINASNITLSPTLPPDNVPVTIQFIAKGNLKNTTQSVFMHSGIVTDGLSSTAWNNTQGVWGDSTTSPGQMTKTGIDTYAITLPSIRQYYNMTTQQNAYKIMAVFRTADGSVVEKDGSQDFQLQILPSRYLEIREPLGNFSNCLVNQTIRITGFTNEISDLQIKVNNQVIVSANSTQRLTTVFTPTATGSYAIEVTATKNGEILSKTTQLVVCANNSKQLVQSLPTGLKYGINYYPNEPNKATLVLHAPTESIRSVHLIGDFNQWQVNCDYLMQWDATKKVFWKTIDALTAGQEYVFQYLLDGETRIGDPYTHKVSDPWNDASIPSATYPNLISYPQAALPQQGETPTIASVLQTAQPTYTWEMSNFKRPEQAKLNIYQLHFRDFTTEGTYLAAIQKLDYLQRMGINAIETLPVSEFEGNDSWGYNPNYYFAADKAYGTANDYKKFVDECHKRGIAVIGDIVLNHAFGTNPHARMYWNKYKSRPANNNPWFNQTSNFSNPGAQWGNDFNHQSQHTQAFVDSVIHFWMKEYKIDGIRFDFTKGFGNTPYPNANCADEWGGCYDATRVTLLKRMADYMWSMNNGATGSHPYVIFEHLAQATEDQELGNYGNGIMLWSGVSPNHKYGEIAMGWAPDAASPFKSDVSEAYYKNKGFTKPIWVSYMESHDEDRLGYFQTAYGNGSIKTDLSVRSKFLQSAAAMNLLLTGPRQIWQFGELGYDYHINFNGRTGKKPVRWDYFDVPERKQIYETYSKLFWLRNRLPQTFHRDIDNPGGTKTNFKDQFKRYHYYSAVGDTAVTIIANTANSIVTGNPDFNASTSNQWFDMNSLQWQNVSSSMTLQPGEYRVFLNKKPAFVQPTIFLTDTLANGVGLDTTNIKVVFSEPALQKLAGTSIGQVFGNENFTTSFNLVDADSVVVPATITANPTNTHFVINPINKLYPGQYKLHLVGSRIQNYGGITLDSNLSFEFTVQVSKNPCINQLVFVSPTHNNNSTAAYHQAATTITASNKLQLKARVVFDAKNQVTLLPGFEATPNAQGTFETTIGGCIEE